jgi:1-acyl-sn-glycerol-3-phosphate acyltransferase
MPNDHPYPPHRYFWFGLVKAILTVVAWVLIKRIHVTGTENIPQEGRLLFVSNHIHHLDSPIIAIVCPRRMNIMAAEKYKDHWFFGPIIWTGGAIWVKRDGTDRAPVKKALAVLKDDKALGIAIEGTRSRSGGLQEGKTGAAYLANRADAPVLPIAVWGTEKVLPALKQGKRAEVHVAFGEPFTLPEGRARTAELEAYTEQIMVRLARLLPEDYRGIYAEHPAVTGSDAVTA